MSSSALTTQIAQLKAGNVQNQADTSSIYSNGQWSFKNSTALTSVTITDAGRVGVLATSPRGVLDLNTTREAKIYLGTAGVIGETQSNAGDYIANNLFVSAETAGTMTYTKTTGDSGNAIVQDFSRGIAFYSGVTGAASSTGTLNSFERMRIDAGGNVVKVLQGNFSNFNSLTIPLSGVFASTGEYVSAFQPTNRPNATHNWWFCKVYAAAVGNGGLSYIVQTATSISGEIWTRYSSDSGSTWTAWSQK